MAFTVCTASAEEINRAAKVYLSGLTQHPEWDEALGLINSFRSGHAYPLQAIKMTLKTRAKLIDSSAVVAQRLKRLPSIAIKLRNEVDMKLSQMQDIGGCRAVMKNVDAARRLIKSYEIAAKKNPATRSQIIKRKDYISEPKTDGYRSYHYVLRYHSTSDNTKDYDGKKIEIQIRSKLQHIWATGLEMAETFSGQALKSKIKTASADWRRFFAVMSSAMAARERCAIVPHTPHSELERKDELRNLEKKINVIDILSGWNTFVQVPISRSLPSAAWVLLILDISKKQLDVSTFTHEESLFASERYLNEEKASAGNDHKQVVLVEVEKVDMLKKAFPNYYLDTTEFIEAIKKEIR